jgi:HK97 family phage prohead protease
MSELEYRDSLELLDVSYPERTIELVVMPYNTPAQVYHRGRVVTEICRPGAFGNIQTRANRVRVNRDHNVERTIGKAVTFHPSRSEGLVAKLRMTPGLALADETLALAGDGVLDASAGFRVNEGGENWPSPDERELTNVWLAHIALTPEPAYESAKVLAVRHEPAQAPTEVLLPNLAALEQELKAERQRELAAALEARYSGR